MWSVCNVVGHRLKNDREKASVGRVVGFEFDRSKQKKGKIRRGKLVVRFDSFYVTNDNTNYLSAVLLSALIWYQVARLAMRNKQLDKQ